MRKFVLNREGFRCIYCDDPVTYSTMTLDHVVLFDQGGAFTQQNLVCACAPCNYSRGWLPAEVFMVMMLNALAGRVPPTWLEDDPDVPRFPTG